MATQEKEEKPAFNIQSDNIGFSNKSKDIFARLEVLESKHKDHEKTRADNSCEKEPDLFKEDPSEEETETITAAFKKPTSFVSRHHNQSRYHRDNDGYSNRYHRDNDGYSNRYHRDNDRYSNQYNNRYRGSHGNKSQGHKRGHIPEHTLHPEKWTRYSLEDVKDEDMSDSSNSRAAFAFLEERRKMREGDIKAEAVDTSETACSKGLFTFKKPTKSATSNASGKKNNRKKSTELESLESDVADFNSATKDENDPEQNTCDDGSDKSKTNDVKLGFKARKNAAQKNLRVRASKDSDED